MATCIIPEVIISSFSSGRKYNWNMEDLRTGASISVAKQAQSEARTLCLVRQDYLISAVPNNPIINVWPLGHTRQMKKMVVPGLVTALAVSRDGLYLIAAIDNKLHLWQVSTGNLLKILPGHFQKICCIKFTSDGSQFISGGDDGVALVWMMSSVLSSDALGQSKAMKPYYTWKNHSMAIKDIYVGYFGPKARVITVSEDQTCKLYHLLTGHLLLTVCMNEPLLSVSMDSAERFIFLGCSSGNIYGVALPFCVSAEIHYEESNDKVFRKFVGHREDVTCLSVSLDGQTLLSGSADHYLKLWDIISQTCVRSVHCDGPVTNAIITMTPCSVKNTHKKYKEPSLEFAILKRQLHGETGCDEDDVTRSSLPLNLKNHHLKTWDLSCGVDVTERIKSPGESDNSKTQLKNEVSSVKKTNEQMYYYLVDAFMSNLRR